VSSPVQVCSGCTTAVLIEDEPTVSNQTLEQFAKMMNFMTHPQSIDVYYASSPAPAGANTSAEIAGLVIIGAGVAIAIYSRRRRGSSATKALA